MVNAELLNDKMNSDHTISQDNQGAYGPQQQTLQDPLGAAAQDHAPFQDPLGVNQWEQHETSDGIPYFYNAVTKITTWDIPDDFAGSPSDTTPMKISSPVQGAIKDTIQAVATGTIPTLERSTTQSNGARPKERDKTGQPVVKTAPRAISTMGNSVQGVAVRREDQKIQARSSSSNSSSSAVETHGLARAVDASDLAQALTKVNANGTQPHASNQGNQQNGISSKENSNQLSFSSDAHLAHMLGQMALSDNGKAVMKDLRILEEQALNEALIKSKHHHERFLKLQTQEYSDLNKAVRNSLKKYTVTKVLPKREIDFSNPDPLDTKFRIAEGHFHRMWLNCNQKSGIVRPEIKSIDIINHPILENKFEHERARLASLSLPSGEVLAYHGTKDYNIEGILENNFQMRYSRRQRYGKGIYFSEFPDYSLGYGEGLLLCRLLPGKEFVDESGHNIPKGFNSKKVRPYKDNNGFMIVIENTDQILPMYVIHF